MKCRRCHESYNKRMQEYEQRIERNPDAKINPPFWENVSEGAHQVYMDKTIVYLCEKHYELYLK